MEGGRVYLPGRKTIIEDACIGAANHDNKINPGLGKHIASVPVNQVSTLKHLIFNSIE
jgi:hypothetical protein